MPSRCGVCLVGVAVHTPSMLVCCTVHQVEVLEVGWAPALVWDHLTSDTSLSQQRTSQGVCVCVCVREREM